MAPQMIPVDEGLQRIKDLIPKVVQVDPRSIKLVDIQDKTMILKVGDESLSAVGSECLALKRLTKADRGMLERLTTSTREKCFDELMSCLGSSVQLKTRQGSLMGMVTGEKSLPNYHNFVDRFMEQVKPIGFSNVVYRKDQISFGMVTEESHTPPKRVDDVINAGIYAQFNGDVRVQPYNMRLVCTNGMITMKRSQATVINEGNFNQVVTETMGQTREVIRAFISLAEQRLQNAGGMVGRLASHRILNTRQVRQITEQLAQLGEDATEFDLVNMITRFQHEQSNSLNWLIAGGRSMNHLHHDHCAHCGAAV